MDAFVIYIKIEKNKSTIPINIGFYDVFIYDNIMMSGLKPEKSSIDSPPA